MDNPYRIPEHILDPDRRRGDGNPHPERVLAAIELHGPAGVAKCPVCKVPPLTPCVPVGPADLGEALVHLCWAAANLVYSRHGFMRAPSAVFVFGWWYRLEVVDERPGARA